MMKTLAKNFSKKPIPIGLFLLLIIAVALLSTMQLSIFPQNSMIQVTVEDSVGHPIPNALVSTKYSDFYDWTNLGTTDAYGHYLLTGYSGIQVQAATTIINPGESHTGIPPDATVAYTQNGHTYYNWRGSLFSDDFLASSSWTTGGGVSWVSGFAETTDTQFLTVIIPIVRDYTPPPIPQNAQFTLTQKIHPSAEAGIMAVFSSTSDYALPSYDSGTQVTFSADAFAGYVFDHWDINGETFTTPTAKVTVNSNTVASLYFRSTATPPPTSSPVPPSTVQLTVDEANPINGQSSWFTVSSNVQEGEVSLSAVVNGQEVAQFGQPLTQGMALFQATASIYGKSVTWTAKVNGVSSNTVTTTTVTLGPTPTIQPKTLMPNFWSDPLGAIIYFFTHLWG